MSQLDVTGRAVIFVVIAIKEGRPCVNRLELARQGLEQATKLPAILSAAYDAFESMLRVIEELQDPGEGAFAALMMSAAAAASGRDAVVAAPSLPPVTSADPDRHTLTRPLYMRTTARQTAAELSGLSCLLASRLADVGALAPASGDQAPCERASRYAVDICSLLGGVAGR